MVVRIYGIDLRIGQIQVEERREMKSFERSGKDRTVRKKNYFMESLE